MDEKNVQHQNVRSDSFQVADPVDPADSVADPVDSVADSVDSVADSAVDSAA
jgi:hypothetical protein